MFQLTKLEMENLMSQFATSSWGGRRKLPLAFTEHGAIMAASVLNSDRAVEMSVYVVRAFVQLRELLVDHQALAGKLAELERRVTHHDNALAEVITKPGTARQAHSIGNAGSVRAERPSG